MMLLAGIVDRMRQRTSERASEQNMKNGQSKVVEWIALWEIRLTLPGLLLSWEVVLCFGLDRVAMGSG